MANLKSDFSISVSAQVDTSQVQKTLNQKKYIVKADIDTSNAVKSLNKLNNLKPFKDLSQDFEKINTKVQLGLKGVDKYNNSFKNLTKTTETFKNSIGDVKERITVMTDSGKILSSTTTQIANGIKDITTTTEKSKGVINGYNSDITRVTKTITDTAGNTKKVVETTEQWTDANKKLHTSIKTVDENGKQLAPNINKVEDAEKKLTNTSNTLTNANKKTGQSFLDIVAKVTKFYTATLPVQMVQKAIAQTTETVKEFDKAITEMGKVSEYSGEKLKAYTRELADVGTEVGRTMTDITNATTGWIKAGYSEDDAKQLAKISSLLQNTADEELSGAEATEILVSQLKAYHMEADRAIEVTDILNNVSANQAVSSGDLAKGLTQASASMATFGNDIEQTTALLTAGTTING